MVKLKNILLAVLSGVVIFSNQVQSREVSDISIKDIGQYDEGRGYKHERDVCKNFRPTKKQIIRFFNLAKESKESGDLLHEYYSPCLSSGTIKFKDGSSGDWTIQSSGLAFAILDNGESLVFFHKDNKWTDPYACTYGLGNDPIC